MIWVGYVICVGGRRNAYTILVRDLDIDGRIILHWILKH
jgi:hypothetical protein